MAKRKVVKKIAGLEFWAEMDEAHCPCGGTGWASRNDWVECPIHFKGQLHPQSKELLLDDPTRLRNEERRSHLKWKVDLHKAEISDLKIKLQQMQASLLTLELELINKTPTTEMPAVNLESLVRTDPSTL